MVKFVGSWRLVASEFWRGEAVVYPLGEQAQGRIWYDGAGNMGAQLMRPERARLHGETESPEGVAALREAFEGYTAYFGTYAVDEGRGVVVHHVLGSLLPNWVGRNLERYYAFADNDTCLTLTTPPMGPTDTPLVGKLVWERLT
jgi:hypothetical protein